MAVSYNPRMVTDGLIFYVDAANFRSYPGTGTSWYDLSNNRNIGTLTNGPTYSNANKGNIIFDGTDDWVDFLPKNIYNIGTGNFSVFCWMKCNSKSDFGTIFALDNEATGQGIMLYTGAGTGILRTWVGMSVRNGSIDICNNAWNFIGICRNSGIVTHYINGISDGSYNAASSILADQNLRLGRFNGSSGYKFNGNLSNVVMYNKALSATEVLQNYNATKGRYRL